MNKAQLIVRKAQREDIEFIVALIDRVQKKLTDSGSLQQIGPVPTAMVKDYIDRSAAHILVESGQRMGSVFVEAVESFPYLQQWDLAKSGYFLWFLCKLTIEPDEQGRSLGYDFLEGIKSYMATQPQPAMIFLDCWAGNTALHAFYTRAGFQLHGIYPMDDFDVAVFTCRLTDPP